MIVSGEHATAMQLPVAAGTAVAAFGLLATARSAAGPREQQINPRTCLGPSSYRKVAPHLPQYTRSKWVAMKMPGPQLGHCLRRRCTLPESSTYSASTRSGSDASATTATWPAAHQPF